MNEHSNNAQEWIEPLVPTLMWNIMKVAAVRGEVSCRQIENLFNMKHQTASSRLTELQQAWLLLPNGNERLVENDLTEGCYSLSQLGRKIMAKANAFDILRQINARRADLTKERTLALAPVKQFWEERITAGSMELGFSLLRETENSDEKEQT